MKNILFSISFILLFVSCKKEEDSFPDLDKRIQNDGYLPLAMDNYWQYETYKALSIPNDRYSYTDDKSLSEQFITNTTQYRQLDSSSRFDYNFSPIDVGSFLGSFIGVFNRISKQNGEYKTKQIIRFRDSSFNGNEKNSLTFELDEQPFLVDKPEVGMILSETHGKVTSPDEAIVIEYKKITQIIDIFPQIPDKHSSAIGVDDHLKKYKDVVHIVDSILIKKITLTEKAENTIAIDAAVKMLPGVDDPNIPGGKTTLNITQDGSLLTGTVRFPVLGIGLANFKVRGENILISKTKNVQLSCEVNGPFKLNKTLKGGVIELMPSASANKPVPFSSEDTYWAKGVGKIKSISKSYKIPIKANISKYMETDEFNIILERQDKTCAVDQKDTTALEATLGINVTKDIEVELPIGGSDFIYVQNLIKNNARNNLN